MLPLSDYAELLAFVDAVDPKTVYTVHGSTAALRGRDAWSPIGDDQLELL